MIGSASRPGAPGNVEGPRLHHTVAHVLRRMRRSPGATLLGAISLARGRMIVLGARMRGVKLRVGRNFRVYGRLDVRGPGEIEFGDDALLFEDNRAWTYAPEARIRIGARLQMTSGRFGCAREITVGDYAYIGASYTIDTNFHSTHVRRHDPASPVRVAPVRLGDNIWVGYGVGILPGTTIGDNSVVALGSVCRGWYPADVIISGNPAHIVATVPGSERERTGSTTVPDLVEAADVESLLAFPTHERTPDGRGPFVAGSSGAGAGAANRAEEAP